MTKALALALLCAASPAVAGVASSARVESVPDSLTTPLTSASGSATPLLASPSLAPGLVPALAPSAVPQIYERISAALLPAGDRGEGSRNQLKAYLDAGDYSRVRTYFKDRMLADFTARQPLSVRAMNKIPAARKSERFREGTELGRVQDAFGKLDLPDSEPVRALNAGLTELQEAQDKAELDAGLQRFFDGVRRRRDAGEISSLYARFAIGEAAKPINATSAVDENAKRRIHARLGDEMRGYDSAPPTLGR